MKEAYVSLILSNYAELPSEELLSSLDLLCHESARRHEILVGIPFGRSRPLNLDGTLYGPISLIITNPLSSSNDSRIALLGRTVGDFVIEWSGDPKKLNNALLVELLKPTNEGYELVEFESSRQSLLSGVFYWFTNKFRSRHYPIRKTISRTISRRALNLLLSRVNFERQVEILFAELSVVRFVNKLDVDFNTKSTCRSRFLEGLRILAKGSHFGAIVPLIFASASATFGILVALYATALFLISGKSPEGWTTLMIVIGLGQASILALMGMSWLRIDSLSRGLSTPIEATAEVVVYSPGK